MVPYDEEGNQLRVARLREQGVEVWGAERVYLSPEVPLGRIEAGAILCQATLTGSNLQIGRRTRIGLAGHARVDDCQIGRDCDLGAGIYEKATLLDGVVVRGFAEMRPGTLLEEQCEAAHTVAFKNTILTACAVSGSVINFCDVFMSGGTSRRDHSEIGSGSIHFNFDPRGDKWGSRLGDAGGLLLRSAPVFVGGQCGLVGPMTAEFGAVIAAGSIVRRDVGGDRVYLETAGQTADFPFDRETYPSLRRKILATARLVGSLHALAAWYEVVRTPGADGRLKSLYDSGRRQAIAHIRERADRLGRVFSKLERSLALTAGGGGERLEAIRREHQKLTRQGNRVIEALLETPDPPPLPQALRREYEAKAATSSHIEAVRGLSQPAADSARLWLESLMERPAQRIELFLSED